MAARHEAARVIRFRRRPHPGIPYWRWLSFDGVVAHAFDEAAGIPWSSACDQARYSLRRVGGGKPCATCRRVIGGGALED